jgi:AGZA family xanthine/uracil permease-like MFS transporter
MSWFGILALIQSVVNAATIGPIVFFVGLQINEEALNFMPSRHFAAYIIGIFPSIYDWVVNISSRSPLTDGSGYNTNYPAGSAGFIGVLAWKRGALLVSMIWVAMVVMVLDRKWKLASIWAIIGSAFALFGIIHVPEAGFDTFNDPTWEQCDGGSQSCWDNAKQLHFFIAYLMLAGTFGLIEVARKFDDTLEGELDDETAHAFDDWFANAGIVVDDEKHIDVTQKGKIFDDDMDEDSPADEEMPSADDAADSVVSA